MWELGLTRDGDLNIHFWPHRVLSFTKVENFQIKQRGPMELAENKFAVPQGFLIFKTIYDNSMQWPWRNYLH